MTEKNYTAKGLTEKIMAGINSLFGLCDECLPFELQNLHPYRENFQNELRHDIDTIKSRYSLY